VHGIQAGTDWESAAVQAGAVSAATIVLGVSAVRLTKPHKARVERPTADAGVR
jgi:hypothetical protein